MPRKLFKRWMPEPGQIRNNRALSFLGNLLHDPNLFHLNRHSVSVAFFTGLFLAFLPIPGQVALGAIAALKFRCNLPITILLIWISNPLTFPIIFYAEYKIGASILMMENPRFSFELSWHWFMNDFPDIWGPLLIGAVITSFFFSCTGYLMVQWFWRWHVRRRWHRRKKC